MQFNGHSDSQDLCSLMDDLVGTDDNVFTLKEKTRHANTANRSIWTWIFEAFGGWQYDDSNNTTDFPSATASLVQNQQDYTLPSEALTIKSVEVKDTGGNWKGLTPITMEQLESEKEFMDTPSQPIYYIPYANSVKLYPAPNYAQATSLRIKFDRETSAFASTDTTKTPGFASIFHEAVAYGSSFIFARNKNLPQKNDLFVAWQDYERRIKSFYQQRYLELFPARFKTHDAFAENI